MRLGVNLNWLEIIEIGTMELAFKNSYVCVGLITCFVHVIFHVRTKRKGKCIAGKPKQFSNMCIWVRDKCLRAAVRKAFKLTVLILELI